MVSPTGTSDMGVAGEHHHTSVGEMGLYASVSLALAWILYEYTPPGREALATFAGGLFVVTLLCVTAGCVLVGLQHRDTVEFDAIIGDHVIALNVLAALVLGGLAVLVWIDRLPAFGPFVAGGFGLFAGSVLLLVLRWTGWLGSRISRFGVMIGGTVGELIAGVRATLARWITPRSRREAITDRVAANPDLLADDLETCERDAIRGGWRFDFLGETTDEQTVVGIVHDPLEAPTFPRGKPGRGTFENEAVRWVLLATSVTPRQREAARADDWEVRVVDPGARLFDELRRRIAGWLDPD